MEGTPSRPFQPYSPQPLLKSSLIHAPDSQVPQLDELLELQKKLQTLHLKAQARVKKTESDLFLFEGVYRKVKERERSNKEREVGALVKNGLPNGLLKEGRIKIKEREREGHANGQREKPGFIESRPGMGDRDGFGRVRDAIKERDRPTHPGAKVKREFSGTPEGDESVRRASNPSAAKAAAIKAATTSHSAASPAERKKEGKVKKRKRLEGSDDEVDSIVGDVVQPPSQRARPSPHPHSALPTPSSSSIAVHPSKPLKHLSHTKPPLLSIIPSGGSGSLLAQNPPGGASSGSLVQPVLGGVASASHSFHPGIATDFNLPPKPTLPPKPSGANSANGGFIYTPTPTDPKDVMEDFTDRKAPPNQTPINSFWKEVESWMKPVGEEDIAWLEFDADDVEPFLIPALGRHYTEVWEEEDTVAAAAAMAAAQHWPRGYSLDRSFSVDPAPSSGGANGASSASGITLHNPYPDPSGGKGKDGASAIPNLPGSTGYWDPKTLTESDLVREEKGLGPISERLMSGFLEGQGGPLEDPTGPGGSTASKSSVKGMDVADLEKRIRAELRVIGLLGEEEPDFSNPLDDDITSTLRRCQTLLRTQRARNTSRKAQLLSIARDRLAYQDYMTTLEGIERGITAGYQKMLKVSKVPKKKKDKHHGASGHGELNGNGADGQAQVVGVGGGNKVVLDPSDVLIERVRLRDRWVKMFGSAMAEWEQRDPGRLTGLPRRSIYERLDDEIGVEDDLAVNELPS